MKCLPERGRIGIFNRSYYEEVLVVRVHPEILANETTARAAGHQKYLGRTLSGHLRFRTLSFPNGFVIRKFFLNVSKKEQKKRFLDRLQQPEKNWKFSSADLHERERWDDYMDAYEEMIANTSTPHSPWFVIPADNKWFTRLAVAAAIVDTLDGLDLAYPKVDAQKQEGAGSGAKAAA